MAQAQFNYTIDDGTITITKYTGGGGEAVISDTINGVPVTILGGWVHPSRTTTSTIGSRTINLWENI